jgi:hypothetical protein
MSDATESEPVLGLDTPGTSAVGPMSGTGSESCRERVGHRPFARGDTDSEVRPGVVEFRKGDEVVERVVL